MNFLSKLTGGVNRPMNHDHITFRFIGIMAAVTLLSAFPSSSLMAENPDVAMLRIINAQRNPALDNFYTTITNSAPWLAFLVPAIIMVVFLVIRNRRMASLALTAEVSVGIAALISTILKFWIDRPRPFVSLDFIEKLSVGGSPSFPSGHTTDAFALAIVVALMFRKWWITLPAFIWAVLVGYSRMHLGVHFPSDVLAGAIIGLLAAGIIFETIVRKIIRRP